MSVWLPTDSIYDLTDYNHNIDYKATVGPKTIPGTIPDFLRTSGYSYFYHLLYVSGLQDFYEKETSKYCLIVAHDDSLSDKIKQIIINADKFTAINLIRFATIPYCLNRNGILAMRGNMVPTADRYKKIFINFDGEKVMIDNTIQIIGINEKFMNKTVLVADNIMFPVNML